MKNKAFGFYTAALTLILTVATLVAVLIYGSKGGVVNSLVPIALGAAAVCEVSLLFGEKVWTDFTGIIAATLLAYAMMTVLSDGIWNSSGTPTILMPLNASAMFQIPSERTVIMA